MESAKVPLKEVLNWLSRQSLARLFSYTRQVERERDAMRHQFDIIIRQLDFEKSQHEDELRKERREAKERETALLDRLLEANRVRPLQAEPGPRETPQQIRTLSPLRDARAKAEAESQRRLDEFTKLKAANGSGNHTR